jgi:hypothetical protein
MLNDESLWAAFQARSLSPADWTHRAHLRVAWMHLARWPSLDEAHLRMRAGIIRLNAVHGLEETPARGYHETLTRVWLALIAAARKLGEQTDSEAFLSAHPTLLDRSAPQRYYSKERLFSATARAIFIAPDLSPLPEP